MDTSAGAFLARLFDAEGRRPGTGAGRRWWHCLKHRYSAVAAPHWEPLKGGAIRMCSNWRCCAANRPKPTKRFSRRRFSTVSHGSSKTSGITKPPRFTRWSRRARLKRPTNFDQARIADTALTRKSALATLEKRWASSKKPIYDFADTWAQTAHREGGSRAAVVAITTGWLLLS